MDTQIVSNPLQCSKCKDRRYIFSSQHLTVEADICPSCKGHSPLKNYPDGLDAQTIHLWDKMEGFKEPQYASRMLYLGKEKTDLIIKNSDVIQEIFSFNRSVLDKKQEIKDLNVLINDACFPSRYINFFEKDLDDVLEIDIFNRVSELGCRFLLV